MGEPRFIKLSKYLTHTAVWEVTAAGTYGDTYVSTSVTGIACAYFQGLTAREVMGSRGIQDLTLEHSLLLYSTPTVKVGDQFAAITDQDGAVMVASARVTQVIPYSAWFLGGGKCAQQVSLEFN